MGFNFLNVIKEFNAVLLAAAQNPTTMPAIIACANAIIADIAVQGTSIPDACAALQALTTINGNIDAAKKAYEAANPPAPAPAS